MDEDYDEYSGDEGFHEDALNNEDYDALYAALPVAKKALAAYNPDIPDEEIKEALYYHYFEVDPALEELRAKYPRKKGTLQSVFELFYANSKPCHLARVLHSLSY